MHQPLDNFESPAQTFEKAMDALRLAEKLYILTEYEASRDIMVDVVQMAAVIHRRVGVLARAKARG